MPQLPNQDNDRMSLRIAAKEKALLMRAAAIQHTNLTEFVLRIVIEAAKHVVEESEQLELSERDSFRVLELLDNPPQPNKKLLAAAHSLPKNI